MIRDNGINYMESLSSIELNNIFNNKYRGNTPLVLYANGGSWDKLSMMERYNYIHNNYDILANGGTLDDIKRRFAEDEDIAVPDDENMFSSGGSIHIKPENRGKFTALKKRTGHSASWFKAHGTPAQKKMAIFALNSRHWKHGDGGNLFLDGGEEDALGTIVLPEIEYTPSEQDIETFHKFRQLFPNKYLQKELGFLSRSDMNKVSQNDLIDNMYYLYEEAGKPGIHEPNFLTKHFTANGNPRAFYDPLTNDMYNITSINDFMSELAHATQHNNPHAKGLDTFGLPSDIKIGGRDGYKRPGHFEYNAHSIIEPAMWKDVLNNNNRRPILYSIQDELKRVAEGLSKRKKQIENTPSYKNSNYVKKLYRRIVDPAFRTIDLDEHNNIKGFSHTFGNGGPIVKVANKHLYDGESEDTQQMYTGFDWWNRAPMTDYVDIAYEPIPDNAPKSKGTPLLDTPIMVQTTPTASTAATFGQYMPKYESTPKRELITLGATAVAPILPSVGQFGLQAMNTAFTPSTWLNPVTGAKLLSPTVGTIADTGIQGAFAYEGLNGLWNQGREGTLLSDPTSTFMHGLEVLPLVGLGSKAIGMGVDAWNKSGMKALWDISRNNTPVNIESSFIPKTIEYVKREPKARLDFLERNPSRISDAERAGVPKGDRNLKTIDRPNRWFPEINESNAYRVSDAQWDAAYSKAIADNNAAEVQRLRELHFYAKTGETPTIQYRGSINSKLRNTYYRNDGSAIWFTPDYDAASFYAPPGTNRPPRAHYIKTKDGKILHIDGAITNFDGSTTPSNWAAIPVENIPENVSKHFPDEEISIGNKIRFKSKPSYVNTGDVVHAAKLEGYNQVDFQNIVDAKASSIDVYPQFTTRYYNNIKLADPITYNDTGNIIPLSKRDNFNDSDIRYGWLPWTIGGTAGYSYLNQDEGPIVAFANGGNLLGEGGLEQNDLSIGNIGFFNHPLLSLKYYGSPLYDLETPFTVAFTDAILKDKDDFMWNGKMYSTDIDWNKKFEKDANGNIPFQEFANYMYPAVIKILKEKGLPLTNAHNIVRLAGLESQYGTNPVSGKGYNLSGIKWNSKTMGNYNHATNSKDNLEYVDFDNLKDYLEFKIDLLNNRYDAINAENDKDFVDRLHQKSSGINKKGFDYSTNYKGYLNMLLNTKSLDKWLKLLYTPVVTQQGNL